MDIILNLDKVIEILELPADVLLAKLFLYFGWIPFIVILIWGIFQVWMHYIRRVRPNFVSKREFILLAIDIPTGNEQSPMAVEHMFAHLAGAHKTMNLIETYWEGQTQDSFSLEIVSIGGYTQFLVRSVKKYQDLLEAMIYAQYPDAEITEVDDYTEGYPDRFPDENYDIWGGEWILRENSVYPIRTYIDFEHQFSTEFKDPMAALMELFSNLRPEEQCWYQIVATPISREWEEEGGKEISRVIGEKVKSKKNILDIAIDGFLKFLSSFSEFIIPLWRDIEEREEEEKEINMLNLRPVQKKRVEAIQQKVSKIGFEVKIRFIYLAGKEVFDKMRAKSFTGVMKQYAVEDLNQLKPDMEMTATTTNYFWKESRLNARKNRIMAAYKSRSNWIGRLPGVLNIEELASLWYFPVELAVKAPMLQKVPSRKTEAPSYLPVEGTTSDMGAEVGIGVEVESEKGEREEIFSGRREEAKSVMKQVGPPANLPIG